MSADVLPSAAPMTEGIRRVRVTTWKTASILAVVTVAALAVYLFAPRAGNATFAFSGSSDRIQLPLWSVSGMGLAWASIAVMALVTIVSVWRTVNARPTPRWTVAAFTVALLVGFLGWAAAGSERSLDVVGLLSGAIVLSVPLVYGAMDGVVGERAGVVNIAIEGQLLAAAFAAALVGSTTRNPWAGLVAAMATGVLVAWVLGVFTISYRANQVIVGVVLNVLIIGLTSFLYDTVMAANPGLNATSRFTRLGIPLLRDIPVLGPVLFDQTIVVYLMVVVVGVVSYALYRTRWGLRLRSVGEHPQAADTVGINVSRVRYRALLLGGAIAGIGGGFFTLVAVSSFGRQMTAGAGFIALAAVIFGKWDPLRAAFAGLLFGFATNLQSVLSIVGSPVPSQFMLMLPYVVTLLAVAGLVGRSRPPAADGEPYIKE